MLVVMLAGLTIIGLLMEFGLLVAQSARLDSATEASAHAALYRCGTANPDESCLAVTAAGYLEANLPGAALEDVRMTETGQVEVRASAPVRRLFGEVLQAAPARIESAFSIGIH